MSAEKLYIYSVDSHKPIQVSANVHNLLITEDLIQYDGTEWLYFDSYEEKIKGIEAEKGKN